MPEQIRQHPLSAAYPAMSPGDFDALSADIKLYGLREPITLYDDEILDGWHRYNACLVAEIEPEFVEFSGTDPRQYVISKNGHRRHLTASQRAAAGIRVYEWRSRGGDQSAPGALRSTDAQIAAALKVSERTVEQVKAADRTGLLDAVRDGKVSAKQAAAVAKAAPNVQAEAKAAIARGEQPKLPGKAKPEPEPEDYGPSDEEIRDAQKEEADELASLRRVAESDDQIAAALAEAKRFRELNRILESRIRGLMNEKSEAISQAKHWQRKFEKAEKARIAA